MTTPASDSTEGRRFLITIGCARYTNPAITDLPGVGHDVNRIQKTFTTVAQGYELVLPELANSPTAEQIRRGVGRWAQATQLGPADVVVVYSPGTANV
jgi:hypothetical protein